MTNDRVLELAGSHNVRDLGGLRTVDGHTVRRGRILRGDYPAYVETDAAWTGLALRTVVDLRRGAEAAFECVDWAGHGVAYHRFPLSAGGADSWHARYPAYLTHSPDAVVAAVRTVLDPRGHAVLFHCAAGKDRTGVVAAIVLALLGVDRADIVADYLLTDQALADILARLTSMEPYAAVLGPGAHDEQRPRAEYLHALLDHLDAHGGAETWCRTHGLSPEEIARGRESLLG